MGREVAVDRRLSANVRRKTVVLDVEIDERLPARRGRCGVSGIVELEEIIIDGDGMPVAVEADLLAVKVSPEGIVEAPDKFREFLAPENEINKDSFNIRIRRK